MPKDGNKSEDTPFDIKKMVKKNLLLITVLSGVVIGIILGLSLRPFNLTTNQILLISYPGEIFLRMLKLLTLPLLISSLISVTAGLNSKLGGRVMLRTMIFFATTSFISGALGIVLSFTFREDHMPVGHGSNKTVDSQSKFLDSFLDLGRNFFPENIFQATFQQIHTVYKRSDKGELVRDLAYRNGPDTLGLVVFCLVFGSIANSFGEKGQIIRVFFSTVFDILLNVTTRVMWLSGIGVCSIITGKLLIIDDLAKVLSQLALFMCVTIFGMLLHQFVLMPAIYFLFIRKNPYKFLYNLREAWVTAFAVASSIVTLPTTIRCMIDEMKHDERISQFVLSLGIYLNTNGTALYMSISACFIAQLNGVTLGLDSLFIILITSTALSMAIPTIPSASVVMLLVVLGAVDLDPSNVSLLFGIDWIIDRFRTTSNVLDDCFAAAIIEKLTEKELEDDIEMTEQQSIDL